MDHPIDTPSRTPETVVSGLVMGESPRWHDDTLWVCDWGVGDVMAVDADGAVRTMLHVESLPLSIDWLPDGRMLVVDSTRSRLLRVEADGEVVVHADLSGETTHPWNEIVVDGSGRAYVNSIGFDLMAGDAPGPGFVALVDSDGSVRRVADGLEFPNGMALTDDGATLLVAESYAGRISSFDVATDGTLGPAGAFGAVEGSAPDGICLDADGAVWFADVPNRRCVRIEEGGRVLDVVDVDRGCFACTLGGADGLALFVVAAEWRGPAAVGSRDRTGIVVCARAPAPRAGRP